MHEVGIWGGFNSFYGRRQWEENIATKSDGSPLALDGWKDNFIARLSLERSSSLGEKFGMGKFHCQVFFESRECVNGLKAVGLCLCVSNAIVVRMDVVAVLCTIMVVG